MEEISSEIVFPTLEQIVHVNRRMIEFSGGSFTPPSNFQYRNALEYILAAIAYPIRGKFLFPSLEEKAAALGYEIIASHVFLDGNKRTGTHMAWEFLQSNNCRITLDHSIEDIAVEIAQGIASRDDFIRWLMAHRI